jgi:UDP-glucose 4-epimerase
LTTALLQTNLDRVVVIDPREPSTPCRLPRSGRRFRWVRQPICSNEARVELASTNYVFHLAASTGTHIKAPFDDVQNGLNLTIQALEATKRAPLKKFVFCSSSAVYGQLAAHSVGETAGPLSPCSAYGASKLAGEAWVSAYASQHGFSAVNCRLGNIIATDLDRGALLDITKQMLRSAGEVRLLGNGEQARTYLSAERCADALIHLANLAHPGGGADVVNVSGIGLVRTKDLVAKVAASLNVTPRAQIAGGSATPSGWPGDVPVVDLDVIKLSKLNWKPPLSAETIEEVLPGLIARLAGSDSRRVRSRTPAGNLL